MTSNTILRLLCFTGFLLFPRAAFGQVVAPPEEQPISGTCAVTLGVATYKKEACELSTGSREIPNGFRLVIEHVSGACSTSPGRGIYTLALHAKASREDGGRMAHIPVRLQVALRDQLRFTGSEMVRIYAGSGTTVELLVSTTDGAMLGHTACDVSFSGFVKRINQ
jgi:hypothetical protein